MKKPQHCGLLNNNVTNYIRTTCNYNRLTDTMTGKKGQFVCDLVKKSEGGAIFLLSRGGVHWHGVPIGMGEGGGTTPKFHEQQTTCPLSCSTANVAAAEAATAAAAAGVAAAAVGGCACVGGICI